jgi:hypothetical protein
MAPLLLAVASLAASSGGTLMPARASATASVRIVSATRVTLGKTADSGNFRVTRANVRTEDGQSRPAQLVEFQ